MSDAPADEVSSYEVAIRPLLRHELELMSPRERAALDRLLKRLKHQPYVGRSGRGNTAVREVSLGWRRGGVLFTVNEPARQVRIDVIYAPRPLPNPWRWAGSLWFRLVTWLRRRPELTGPAIRRMLGDEQRDRFDTEFRQALMIATRDFDLAPVGALLRRWWVAGGGDPRIAEQHRQDDEHDANFVPTQPHHTIPEWRVHGRSIPITGPAAFDHLPPEGQVMFEERWHALIADATTTFDIQPLYNAVRVAWFQAMTHINRENNDGTVEPGCPVTNG